MPRVRFTEAAIAKFKAPHGKQIEYSDSKEPGLGMRVSYGGKKAFFVGYRFRGRQTRCQLGSHPYLSLDEARIECRRIRGLVDRDQDPAADRLRSKRDSRSMVFGDLIERYIEAYAKPKNRSWRPTQLTLQRYFVSRWENLEVGSIDKSMVRNAVDEIVEAGTRSAANQAFANIRTFFNWCVQEDLRATSPCAGLKMPAKLRPRERILSHDEIAAILKAVPQLSYPFEPMIKMLFFTGQRRTEVAGLRRSEINFEKFEWTLVASRTKADRTHTVPLVPTAVELLRSLPDMRTDLLFPARGRQDSSVSGFSHWKEDLDKLSGVRDWRIHDIRRTVATNLARLRVRPHVIERVLNHAGGEVSGIAATYNRHDYLDECRSGLELWEKEILKISGQT